MELEHDYVKTNGIQLHVVQAGPSLRQIRIVRWIGPAPPKVIQVVLAGAAFSWDVDLEKDICPSNKLGSRYDDP